MIGIDANVLVRYIVRDDHAQAVRSDRLMGSLTQGNPGFVNRIVLCELVWVLSRGYRYDRRMVAAVLERLLSVKALEVEDHDVAIMALETYRAGKVDFADALIGLLNLRLGCTFTATLDGGAPGDAGFKSL